MVGPLDASAPLQIGDCRLWLIVRRTRPILGFEPASARVSGVTIENATALDNAYLTDAGNSLEAVALVPSELPTRSSSSGNASQEGCGDDDALIAPRDDDDGIA